MKKLKPIDLREMIWQGELELPRNVKFMVGEVEDKLNEIIEVLNTLLSTQEKV